MRMRAHSIWVAVLAVLLRLVAPADAGAAPGGLVGADGGRLPLVLCAAIDPAHTEERAPSGHAAHEHCALCQAGGLTAPFLAAPPAPALHDPTELVVRCHRPPGDVRPARSPSLNARARGPPSNLA